MSDVLDPVKAALYLARRAHDGQRDKAGEPYIMHPLRVMRAMASDDIAGQVVAVLHDVIEDTPVTIPELVLFGFSEEIVRAVDVVTHRRDETYRRYLERIAGCPLTRRVKLEYRSVDARTTPARVTPRSFRSHSRAEASGRQNWIQSAATQGRRFRWD